LDGRARAQHQRLASTGLWRSNIRFQFHIAEHGLSRLADNRGDQLLDGNSPSAPTQQTVPVQEPGTRPGRPLPYQPNAVSMTDCGGGAVLIAMTNAGTESVHFAIYHNAYRTDGPWQYDVDASNSVSDSFDVADFGGGLYDLTCYGPNGFQRRFAGNMNTKLQPGRGDFHHRPGCWYHCPFHAEPDDIHSRLHGHQRLSNRRPWTYNVPPGSTVNDTFPAVANNSGFYDLTATADSGELFVRDLPATLKPSTSHSWLLPMLNP